MSIVKNRAIEAQLIKPVAPGSPGAKGKVFLERLLKDYFAHFNIAYSDPCCASSGLDPESLPVRFNPDTDVLEFFNPVTQAWEAIIIADGSPEEMDIFLVAGQSNAKGMAQGTGPAPTPQEDTIFQYYLGAFSEVTTDVGNFNGGSAWPAFGITYNNITGKKIAFVPTAVNSTSQVAAADTGAGNWSQTGTLFDNSVTQVNAAIAAITTAGYTPVFKGVLWSQGESDAEAINATTITQTQYTNELRTMIGAYRTDLGADMPFYIFRTGSHTVSSDVGYAAVRAAQEAIIIENPILNKIVFRNALDFIARALMVDTVHYTQAGYNEMGEHGAENILNGEGSFGWQRQGTSALYTPLIATRVGIGITNPTISGAKLQVRDDGGFTAHFTQANSGVSTVRVENTTNGSGAGAGVRFYNNTGIIAQIIAYSQLATSFGPASSFLFHVVPGNARIISNSGDIDFATGNTGMANNKMSVKNNGQVVIGSGNLTATTSSLLDMQSTTQAFIPPRMTTTQKNAIATPSAGMVIYDTTLNKLCVYTTGWETITSA